MTLDWLSISFQSYCVYDAMISSYLAELQNVKWIAW